MKEELFKKALACTASYVATEKASINDTIHYYLDREFLKTLCQGFPDALVPAVNIATSIAILFILSWQLSILIIAIMIFFTMFTFWRNFYTSIFQKKYWDKRDDERHLTMDIFNGFQAVQLYEQEEHEIKRLRKELAGSIASAKKLYTFDVLGDFFESQVRDSLHKEF